MIGILVGVGVSWLLLWFLYKKNIGALGLGVSKRRVVEFTFGLLAAATCCAIYFLSIAGVTNSELSVNLDFTIQAFFSSVWWTLKSVLFEELLFRGVLLYIAIRIIGAMKACLLSAIAFGIYHWFSYGIFGNVVPMIYVFILTGVAGLMFAIAFAETKSMYMPIGLHLGWNLVTIVVFSQGPIGQQLLISEDGNEMGGIWSLVMFLFQIIVLPIIVYWYLKRANYSPSIFRSNT